MFAARSKVFIGGKVASSSNSNLGRGTRQPYCFAASNRPTRYLSSNTAKQPELPASKMSSNQLELSPLAKHLRDTIKISGPLSVAHWIRSCLIHPLGGYYLSKPVFGKKGDFTTSPEISQLFGEMVGCWITQGVKTPISLVELGPGKGTLMRDILHVIKQFPSMNQMITDVHFVEASPRLRAAQQELMAPGVTAANDSVTAEGIHFHWHDNIESVPEARNYVISHEFFDALPCYKFEFTADGWRELVVDEEQGLFKLCLANQQTQPLIMTKNLAPAQIGDRIEISPDTAYVSEQIWKKMGKGSCWLCIDYGQDGPSRDSLRGIKDHAFCSPFSDPGSVDLSIDVDFSLFRTLGNFSMVSQKQFLTAMGIGPRLLQLLGDTKSKEQRQELYQGYDRLVNKMNAYQVSCVWTEGDAPWPFGKDVFNTPDVVQSVKEITESNTLDQE